MNLYSERHGKRLPKISTYSIMKTRMHYCLICVVGIEKI